MAALTGITAVRPTANTVVLGSGGGVVYGATIAAGQPLYQDTADKEFKLADVDLSEAAANVRGISITPGVDGGNGLIAIQGDIILVGTTMAVGETYYAGPTAGEIIPDADLTTGNRVTRLGTAATTTTLRLSIEATKIVHP